MKIRIVSSSELTSKRLDATHYVDPTWKVDKQIAAAEKALTRAEVRLAGLKAKRKKILAERGLEGWTGWET